MQLQEMPYLNMKENLKVLASSVKCASLRSNSFYLHLACGFTSATYGL